MSREKIITSHSSNIIYNQRENVMKSTIYTKRKHTDMIHRVSPIFYLLLSLLVLGMTLAGCEGSTGPEGLTGAQGEQGPQGPQGEEGPQGPSGEDGNANVLLYEFGEQTFTNVLSLQLSVSRETVDNSLILVYYNPSNEASTSWYAIPGLGSGGNYQTRYFIYQSSTDPSVYTLSMRTLEPDGSGLYGSQVTFTKIKVIFAEASSIISAKAKSQLDLRDYNAVKAYYGIPD